MTAFRVENERTTDMNETPTQTAERMGREAFDQGKIGAFTPEFLAFIGDGPVGTKLPEMRAWSKGWNDANLAAPVEW